MSACVTPSLARCSVCAGLLEGKYANAQTCSGRCRQKAYRRRRNGKPSTLAEIRRTWFDELSANERRKARDQLAREVARLEDARRQEGERWLFADDPGRRHTEAR